MTADQKLGIAALLMLAAVAAFGIRAHSEGGRRPDTGPGRPEASTERVPHLSTQFVLEMDRVPVSSTGTEKPPGSRVDLALDLSWVDLLDFSWSLDAETGQDVVLGLQQNAHEDWSLTRNSFHVSFVDEAPGIGIPLTMNRPAAMHDYMPILEKLTDHDDPQIAQRAKAALRQVRG